MQAFINLDIQSPVYSSNLPMAQKVRTAPLPLLGLAPGGVCNAFFVTKEAVGFYPAISPLPVFTGGILSVALSLRSPSVLVKNHPVLRRPDFPLPEGSECHRQLTYFLMLINILVLVCYI